MKKIYLLLLLSIATLSCQKEELVPIKEQQHEAFKTLNISDALTILSQNSSKKVTKEAVNPYVVPRIEEKFYLEIKNRKEKILVIPADHKNLKVQSRFFFLEVKGIKEAVIFNLYPNSSSNSQYFSGRIGIFDLEYNYIAGYRVEDGIIISEFVRGKSTQKSGDGPCADYTEEDFNEGNDWDCLELDEVYLETTREPETIYVLNLYPTAEGSGGDEPSIDYGTGSYGGGATGTTTTTTEEEDKIENNLTVPCAKDILEKLLELSRQNGNDPSLLDQFNHETGLGLYFSEAILNLLESSDDFTYIVGNNSNVSGTGRTDPRVYYNSATDKYKIYSDFNTTYLNTATRLSIARTMIHESMHAYLIFERQRDYTDHMHEALNNYAKSNGFLPGGDGNLIHHNFMAQFVDAIAYQLAVWDKQSGTGTDLGWQYYHDLAWGGLANYEVNGVELFYKEFENYLKNLDDPTTAKDESLAVKERILKNIVNEAVNNLSAKGDDCP